MGKKWRVLNVCARETMNEHGFSRYETLCMCALFFYCVKYTKSCLFFVRLLSLYNVFVTFNIYTADRLGHFQKIEQHIQKDEQHDSYCFFLSSFHPISNGMSLFCAFVGCAVLTLWRV